MPSKKAATGKKKPAKKVSGKKALKKPAAKKTTAPKKKARKKAVTPKSKPKKKPAGKKAAKKTPASKKAAPPRSTEEVAGFTPAPEGLRNYLEENHPDVISDGEIVWEKLKLVLGDDAVSIGDAYNLSWTGKKDCMRLLQIPATKTLNPLPEESVDFENARNVFIEGENLEALKILHKSLAGTVKMIYIDPPYNIGTDRIYKDDYSTSVDEYLRASGQVDEEGDALVANLKTSGRFHSNWLSMMYPRLYLAKTLLDKDGVIFVSIDDNEVHNLRMLMDVVFDERNYVATIPWQSRQSLQNDTDISVNHEFILIYAKLRRKVERRLKEKNADRWYKIPGFVAYPLPLDPLKFSNPDDDPRGPWKDDPFDAPNIRPNLTYAIVNPNTGKEFWPPRGRCWRTEEKKYKGLLADKRIVFGKTGKAAPKLKVFYEEKKDFGEVENTWFDGAGYDTATHGTKEIQALFDGITVFDSPKPVKLMKSLIRLATRGEDIVLDFFAGTGTTAEAVIEQNREDGQKRKYIMVQFPEPTDNYPEAKAAGYKTISEIGKERIRRVIQRDEIEGYTGHEGMRVFEVIKPHLKKWPGVVAENVEEYEEALESHAEQISLGESDLDLAWEIAINEGMPLTSSITEISITKKYSAFKFENGENGRFIHLFLGDKTPKNIVEKLGLGESDILLVPDESITDEQATNIGLMCKLKVV